MALHFILISDMVSIVFVPQEVKLAVSYITLLVLRVLNGSKLLDVFERAVLLSLCKVPLKSL